MIVARRLYSLRSSLDIDGGWRTLPVTEEASSARTRVVNWTSE